MAEALLRRSVLLWKRPLPQGRAAFAAPYRADPITRSSIAARDVDRALFAVPPGNRDWFIGAARRIGPLGRRNGRRTAMHPIPGDVIGAGGAEVRRRRLREIRRGLAERTIGIVSPSRPETGDTIPSVMPEPMGSNRRARQRMWMRRSESSMRRCARPGERRVRCKQKGDCADGGDERPCYSVRHGTNSSGY